MNPVALITGASRGIGRGIALALAAEGHDLVINYAANTTAAAATASDCAAMAAAAGHRIRVECCQADVSERPAREQLIQFTQSRFGRIDLLVTVPTSSRPTRPASTGSSASTSKAPTF
jgi:3-oxoacyl-[acyl-carrier protein] reductase